MQLVEKRLKETFSIDCLLKDTIVTKEQIQTLKSRIIDCTPQSVNHLCEYTKDYVQRVLGIPKCDHDFKISVSWLAEFLQIKYSANMTNKIIS